MAVFPCRPVVFGDWATPWTPAARISPQCAFDTQPQLFATATAPIAAEGSIKARRWGVKVHGFILRGHVMETNLFDTGIVGSTQSEALDFIGSVLQSSTE